MYFNVIRFAFCSKLFTVSFTLSSDTVSCSFIINLGLVSARYVSLSNYLLICDVYIQGAYTGVFPGLDHFFFPLQKICCLLQ